MNSPIPKTCAYATPRRLSAAFAAFLIVLMLGASTTLFAGEASQPVRWQQYNALVQKDPALVRHYLFQEGKGTVLANSAGDGKGAMNLTTTSPYGESRETRWVIWCWPSFQPAAEWISGRWPGKHGLMNGMASTHATTRSLFNGTKDGVFTLVAWVQMFGSPVGATDGMCRLFNIGDAYKTGWSVSYNRAKWLTEGGVEFRFGTPTGPITVMGKPFAAQIWHQVACQWDGKAIRIFIDGAPAGETPCAGPYVPEALIDPWALGMLEFEIKGLNVGGRASTKQNPERFAVDELAIFSRALTTDEIRAHYEAGRPDASADEQRTALALVQKERILRENIRLDIPKETDGYFHLGKKIPATVAVTAQAGLSGAHTAHYLLRDLQNQVLADQTLPLNLTAGQEAAATLELAPEKCGVYFLDLWLTDTTGKTLKRLTEEYSIGITVPLPPAKDVPPSSPLAAHAISSHYPENRFLGFGVDRWIKSNAITHEKGKVNENAFKQEMDFEKEAGLKVMFCLHLFSPSWAEKVPDKKWLMKDMSIWADYCKMMVRKYKDEVVAWEIENEPNAGGLIAADEYVEFLKVGYQAIKEVDPQSVVVGLCGCPGFLNWNEAVYKAGGAKFFDVLALHNYTAFPISAHRQERHIERAIEQLKQYRGELVPVWNSETGFIQVTRVNGRPMTEDVFTRRYAAKIVVTPGKPPMLPGFQPVLLERTAACWQIQSIMLDLGAGCAKYFMLAGGSHYYPVFNESDGQPAEYGVATAAAASALMNSTGVKFLPLSSGADAGVIISNKDGTRTACLFSDETPTLSFRFSRPGIARGMDMLGNAQQWNVGENGILTLRIGSDPVYLFDIPSDFAQLRLVSIGTLPDALPETGVMNGELTVTNPFDRPLSATLRAEAPKGTTLQVEATVSLAAKQSKTIPFRFDGQTLKRRRYEFSFNLIEGPTPLGKASHMFFSEGGIRAVSERNADAQLGDGKWWQEIPAEVCNEEDNVVHGKPIVGVPWAPQWRGPKDLAFNLRQAWTHDGALLVRVEVTDDVVMPATPEKRREAFRYDSLELFFDGRPLAERKEIMTPGVEQMVVIPRTGEGVGACDFWFAGKKPTIHAEFTGGSLPNGYWIEGRLRPADGNDLKVRAGTQYALDAMIDDMDKAEAPRQSALALHGLFNNASDPSKWGRYQMQPTKLTEK